MGFFRDLFSLIRLILLYMFNFCVCSQAITETITVTHFEDNKKSLEEKDRKIDDLLNVRHLYRGQGPKAT